MSLAHVDVDFAGTCDSTGAATIPLQALASQYGVLKVMGETKGSAQWTVLVKGRPVTPGRGPRVDLGPIAIQPGEQITISIVGALAGAAVTGKLHGIGASSAQEALSNYVPSPNTIALDTFNQQTLLGSILTAGGGVAVSKTFTIPPATQGVGYLIDQNAGHTIPTTNGGITMVGNVSAYPYITFVGPSFTAAGQSFVEQSGSTEFFASIDSSIVCTVKDPNVGTPSLVYFYAYAYNPKVRSDLAPQGSAVPVTFVSAPVWQTPASVAAVINQSITNGTGATIIPAANPGLDTYLFWCALLGNATALFFTLKGHTSGFVIGVGLTAATTAGTGPHMVKDFHGAKVGDLTGNAGEAIDLFNNGGGPVNFFGTLDYRQA